LCGGSLVKLIDSWDKTPQRWERRIKLFTIYKEVKERAQEVFCPEYRDVFAMFWDSAADRPPLPPPRAEALA